MDRETLERHLQEAEARVAESALHVVAQRNLLAKLRRKGRDTATAQALLELLEERRTLNMADRDRLRELRKYEGFQKDV
jgi:hypothetical protein